MTYLITDRIDAGDLVGFQCSERGHNDFFARSALAQDRARLAGTFVLRPDDDDPSPGVLGYYSLAAGTLKSTASPSQRMATPVVVLQRFAVKQTLEGSGVAQHLLVDAFVRVARISAEGLGASAVLSVALSPRSMAFLSSHGFTALGNGVPCETVIPMSRVVALVKSLSP